MLGWKGDKVCTRWCHPHGVRSLIHLESNRLCLSAIKCDSNVQRWYTFTKINRRSSADCTRIKLSNIPNAWLSLGAHKLEMFLIRKSNTNGREAAVNAFSFPAGPKSRQLSNPPEFILQHIDVHTAQLFSVIQLSQWQWTFKGSFPALLSVKLQNLELSEPWVMIQQFTSLTWLPTISEIVWQLLKKELSSNLFQHSVDRRRQFHAIWIWWFQYSGAGCCPGEEGLPGNLLLHNELASILYKSANYPTLMICIA